MGIRRSNGNLDMLCNLKVVPDSKTPLFTALHDISEGLSCLFVLLVLRNSLPFVFRTNLRLAPIRAPSWLQFSRVIRHLHLFTARSVRCLYDRLCFSIAIIAQPRITYLCALFGLFCCLRRCKFGDKPVDRPP